jgi:hypothetical protein
MLYTLVTIFINTLGVLYLTNFLCEHFFPEKTSIVKQHIIWTVMRYYTIMEIKANSYKKKLHTFIIYIFPLIKKEDIFFIKNGEIIKAYYYDRDLNEIQLPDYQFILYFLKVENNEKFDYNVIRFNKHIDLLKYKYNNEIIKPSRLNFLGLQFKNDNINGYPISINFGRNNFFMDKNILLDRHFVIYYLNTTHNIKLNDNDEYNITFIDKEMNIITITEHHRIEVKNNNYEIWYNIL